MFESGKGAKPSTLEKAVLFNKTFADANRTKARYRLLMGGAGSGKSVNVARDYLLKLSDPAYRGANLLVIRKTESSLRSSVFEELLAAAPALFGRDWPAYLRVSGDPLSMESTVTGNRILFRGMHDNSQREKVKSVAFRSGKLTWIWIEEATELCEEDFEILDDRLRGELQAVNPNLYYQITMTFNPVSAGHWLKRRFFDTPPSAEVYRHRSTFRDNAFIDPDYAARMERRRQTDPVGYKVYGEGEWGERREGRILTNWRVDVPSRSFDDYDGVWMAQDFGFHHADCILLVGVKDGTLYVLRELYVKEKDTEEIIALAHAAGFPRHLPMYCDSAEPDRIRSFRKAGWRAVPVKKGPGSVLWQIDCLRGREIVIHKDCVNTLTEIRDWHFLTDAATGQVTDVPCPEKDDAMAALRYATEPLRKSGVRSFSKRALGL